jgi:voltage-gated potassium channel Kch
MGRLIPHALIFPFARFGDNPFGALMGVVILFVGVSIAVRLTAAKAVEIDGPFENSVKPLG